MSTSDSIYLGLGCFHFSIRKSSGVPLSGTKYLDEVRVSLERLPEVENVSIHVDDEFGGQPIPLSLEDLEVPPLAQGGYAIPDIGFSDILVVLGLSRELQSELLKRCGSLADPLSGERFLICFRHGWAMPQAMVWSIDAKDGYSGSQGIKLAREYFKTSMASSAEPIAFESLGPSPAHVDVVLDPRSPINSDPSSEFLLQSHTQPSYHLYKLAYDPSVFALPRKRR